MVTGGSGFIGQYICVKAASMNIPVVSISRSGKPDGFHCNNDSMIKWVKADIFEPGSWNQYLCGCRAIMHCVAILFQNPSKNITHERFIYESVRIVGDEAVKAGIRNFVFISAAIIPVFSSKSYNASKRKAEDYLSKLNFKLAVLRPGLIYGIEKPLITKMSLAFNLFAKIPGLKYILPPIHPLPAKTIAKVALLAATSDSIKGIFNTVEIEILSNAEIASY